MGDLRVTLDFQPYRHQREAHALRRSHRHVVMVWHRRAGKTVFAVVELLLAALSCERERGRYVYLAPYLRQARDVAWDYLRRYARAIPGTEVREAELAVDLPNGARVRLYGADNPDALRGIYLDGVVLDEVADMRPQVWGEIVRPALADREGWSLWIGTPKGVNLFSETYQRARREEGWTTDLRRASETGAIPEAELLAARREMTDAQWAQEMECDFAASVDDVLLRLDAVLEAQKRTCGEADFRYAPKVLGVDVARYGGDRSVLFPRQGLVAMKPRILRGVDSMTVANHVGELMDKWEPDAVFIDGSPASYGVIDRLRQLGRTVIPVDFGGTALDPRYENRRAEMWWLMAEWVRTGCLPDSTDLIQDLTAIRYTYANARGRLALESKDDLKARGLPSPDLADALALTFAAPVARANAHARTHQHAGRDYDPFARSA